MSKHPIRCDCEECGEGIKIDEDGCCVTCGGDAVMTEVPGGRWVLLPPATEGDEPEGARAALGRVRIALDGFGNGSLARIAKHFPTGSEEWAIIHNADESIALAITAALTAEQEET